MSTQPTSTPGALPILLAGAFMVVLDFFIVNVALASIATDLDAGEAALEWMVAGYGLSFAAFLVLAGRLGDEHGRRRVYAIGLALFTLASAACGLAPSAETLLAARIAQGAAGAILMPQVLSIIGVTYRDAAYGRALSAYALTLGLAAVGGQVIGGALVELDLAGLGWRACFLINVPIGLAALAFAGRSVPESRAPAGGQLDLLGAAVLALGLVAVLLPLIEGRQQGWPLWTWISLVAAVDLLVLFAWRQRRLIRRGEAPLLDVGLFRERAFSAGLAAQLLLACAQASFFVYLALYLQQVRGLGPLEAGLVFSIVAITYVAASGPSPRLAERNGRATIATGGAALAGGFMLLAAIATDTDGAILALSPGLLLVGAGIGLCLTPLTATVLAGLHPRHAGAASGALATTQQVGYALGVAITGLVYFAASRAGTAEAFEASLWQLTALAAGILAMTPLLPRAAAINAAPAVEPASTPARG